MNYIIEAFSYPFAIRAIIAGVLISVCGALLGVNLVLKRFSMFGDGLSHVSFGAAAIALAAGIAPLTFSIPIVIIAAIVLLKMNEKGIGGDAATAIVSSSAMAIGIIVASLTTGMNTDISNYMFGSVLAISKTDVVTVLVASIIFIFLYLIFYRKIFSCTFDERFASATGVNVNFYNTMTAILTAVIVVIGMRIMGALLISSIITFPALSSMRVCKKYRTTAISSVFISIFAFAVGIMLSFIFDIPTGASVVIVNLFIFITASIIKKIKN